MTWQKPFLAAYFVVTRADAFPEGSQARALLLRVLSALATLHLPSHMVPSQFLLLPSLPHTATGKLDRASLTECAKTLPLEGEASGEEEGHYGGWVAPLLRLYSQVHHTHTHTHTPAILYNPPLPSCQKLRLDL